MNTDNCPIHLIHRIITVNTRMQSQCRVRISDSFTLKEYTRRRPWGSGWSTYEISADFRSFFQVSDRIKSPVTMSIFICRLCLTPVGEPISWIPEPEGSFSPPAAPRRLFRSFLMKLMFTKLCYCPKVAIKKKDCNLSFINKIYKQETCHSFFWANGYKVSTKWRKK